MIVDLQAWEQLYSRYEQHVVTRILDNKLITLTVLRHVLKKSS
jgi:hypothetical protein